MYLLIIESTDSKYSNNYFKLEYKVSTRSIKGERTRCKVENKSTVSTEYSKLSVIVIEGILMASSTETLYQHEQRKNNLVDLMNDWEGHNPEFIIQSRLKLTGAW